MNDVVIKKKKFGIPSSLSKGLVNTISMAENHILDFKNAVIPLSCIEIDPDNPRRMKLSPEELLSGFNEKTEYYLDKSKELESLQELSWSIDKKGLINPITVYQRADKYRLVAGERRYMASLLANKKEIEARIYKVSPSEQDLKLVQWIENTAREDLCLADKLANIESIINVVMKEGEKKLSVDVLMELTGLAKTNAYRYLSVLNNQSLRKFIDNGDVSTLRAASLLADIKDEKELSDAINRYKKEGGTSLAASSLKEKKVSIKKQETRGRAPSSVNLGKVNDPKVVKIIVDVLVGNPSYQHYEKVFSSIDWKNLKEVTQSFKKLLSMLEREI